ncbi:hypothetical protein BKA63DRAFT_301526 [Paraphoma chrysanthemicola]|nr:hypothetical protein BKA63DRAFT_301526 [Paraphoma chrysanthemicola]
MRLWFCLTHLADCTSSCEHECCCENETLTNSLRGKIIEEHDGRIILINSSRKPYITWAFESSVWSQPNTQLTRSLSKFTGSPEKCKRTERHYMNRFKLSSAEIHR